jgi:hypothetical protein
VAGLVGVGKAGIWQIDVDEVDDAAGESTWGLTLLHPQFSLQVPLADLGVVRQLLTFLIEAEGSRESFVLGNALGGQVSVIRDEGALRFKLFNADRVGVGEFPGLLEVLCQESDTATFRDAVRDLLRDLP